MSENNFPKIDQAENKSGGNWMMTFADLLSLMLVFFILIYSMAKPDEKKWQKVADSLNKTFNAKNIMTHDISYSDFGIETKEKAPNKNLQYVYAIILNGIHSDIFLNDKVDASISDNKISISFKNINLFLDDSLMNTDESEVLFFGLGEILKKLNNKIVLYSYFDEGADVIDNNIPLKKAIILSKLLKKYSPENDIEANFAIKNPTDEGDKQFYIFLE